MDEENARLQITRKDHALLRYIALVFKDAPSKPVPYRKLGSNLFEARVVFDPPVNFDYGLGPEKVASVLIQIARLPWVSGLHPRFWFWLASFTRKGGMVVSGQEMLAINQVIQTTNLKDISLYCTKCGLPHGAKWCNCSSDRYPVPAIEG